MKPCDHNFCNLCALKTYLAQNDHVMEMLMFALLALCEEN